MDTIRTTDALIDALGGTKAVADRCGCKPSAVSNWRKDGIPASRHLQLVRFAEREGLQVDIDAVFPPRSTPAAEVASALRPTG